jgi:GTP cyclohydrolase I
MTRTLHKDALRTLSAPTGQEILERAFTDALAVVDDNTREGLLETPKRWAKMFRELTSGHEFKMTTFENPGMDEMVVEVGIPFFSLCEHHVAPFFGTACVAYIPNKRIVGISKLCRTVEHFSRRLQVQERMTQQVADMLQERLKPRGVAVLIRARHMCQEMRGIRKSGVQTVTSCLRGAFLKKPAAREEFMRIAREG